MNRQRWVPVLWLVGAVPFLPCLLLEVARADDVSGKVGSVTSALGIATIGVVAVILCRQVPGNRIGWLYLGAWAWAGVTQAIIEYGIWAEVHQPDAAATTFSTWVANWSWVPLMGAVVLLPLLLYPDGELPSPRWRWVGQLAVAVIVLWTITFAFNGIDYSSASGDSLPTGNPLTPDGIEPVFDVGRVLLAGVFLALVFAAVVSLFLRYRRGDNTVRAQLKWFAFAGTVWLVFLSLPADYGKHGWIDALLGLTIALMPVAICIAITRHGLYEIDRIISRTLAYAIVTGLVIATYALLVTTITRLLPSSSSTLAVTIATLTAAALFQPLLRIVRGVIDRRFNRARYDAQRTLDSFGERLRHEIDQQALSQDLVSVVGSTVQPDRLRLWLRHET